MACSLEDAAISGTQWENMSWTAEIAGSGFGIKGDLNRAGAVFGRDSGGDADAGRGIDTHCKCSLVGVRIFTHHQR